MCVLACKYFKDVGWVGVKNRDRNYRPTIRVVQSFRGGTERLYIMDSKTKWTEGLNRDGIAIISTATAVIKDEKESTISSSSSDNPQAFASPGGKTIRNALLLHDLDEIV